MDDLIQRTAEAILGARQVMALTGAGISVESGIPPFRGQGGLWAKYDPEEYAHIDAFRRNPGKVWEMLREMRQVMARAKPNPAHTALAELEALGRLSCIVTQNVDGLHQEAGSRNVVEFHGNDRELVCMMCGVQTPSAPVALDRLPPMCACGGVLKPTVVMFGETIPPDALARADEAAGASDVALIAGASAEVFPAAQIPYTIKRNGGVIIEFNIEPTALTGSVADWSHTESASTSLSAVAAAVRARLN
jgi:NAD-dependent deacetylase